MHFPLVSVALLAASAIAAPASVGPVVHEKREHTPKSWTKKEPAHPEALLPMRIGLVQSNLDKGRDMLLDVSSHDSPNFGSYYSPEDVRDIFAPSKASVDAVTGWLISHGIAANRISQSWNKQWIQFDALTKEAENLLQTKYHVYEHTGHDKQNIACDEYSVPSHIREHVDYITPGIKLISVKPKPRPASSETDLQKRTFGIGNGQSPSLPILSKLPMPLHLLKGLALDLLCNFAIVPECIKTMYNISKPTKHAAGNELGIFEGLGDIYSQQDLNSFFLTLAPNIPQGTHPTLHAIDGATAPSTSALTAGPESDLDFEISYPIIYPQNSILFQTDDNVYQQNYAYQGFLNNFLDAIDGSYCSYTAFGETGNAPGLDPPYPDPAPGGHKGQLQCGVYKPTNVISVSYGGAESDLPAYYQQRQCNELMKLGMQGVSIVISSGDSGVSGPTSGSDNGCLGPDKTIFSPDFPATCPYVTVLGATYLPPNGNVHKDTEVAVTHFPSGGGFSNIYGIPDYQKSAVDHYFATSNPPYKSYSSTNNDSFGAGGGIYNRNGRGYPDFAAIGDNVVVFTMGAPNLIGGTSASAPVFASILTRINEERLAVGKKTVGFVNPTLYAHPEVFHDITVGSNPGCGTNGFAVAKGWDPVTGLGTPSYDKMLALYMSLP